MRFAFQVVLGLLLAVVVAGTGSAGEAKAKKEKKPKGSPAAGAFNLPASIELTAEQKAKVEELKKEFEPKLTEALAKRAAVLTPDQVKARAEAQKSAKAAGKKGKEAKEAIDAAVTLTPEQKKELADAEKSVGELQKSIRGKLQELLTPEQRAALGGKDKKAKKAK